MNSLEIDWNRDEASSLVSIGDRKLFLRAQGPPRAPGQPVVVIEAGMGDDHRTWGTVQSLVSKFTRILAYDRAGANKSKSYPGPNPRTATAMAKDLSDLLAAANVPGPYVVACHSYGGLIAREFLALKGREVVGMVFVDTNTENTRKENPFPMEAFDAIADRLDYYEITGLNREHKIDPKLWEEIKGDSGASGQEYSGALISFPELAEKNQFERQAMGDRPVVVIRGNVPQDMRKFYEAAVKKGVGSEEDRAQILKLVENSEEKDEWLQKEQLKLSSRARFVQSEKSGHNVQLTEPELVAGEIEKVLMSLSNRNECLLDSDGI